MKRLFIALVMLCVFVLVIQFNVLASVECNELDIIVINEDSLRIELNGEQPNYKELVKVYRCGVDVTETVNLTIDSNFVDTATEGTYNVIYLANDGVLYTVKTIEFTVKEDITPPVLNGYYDTYYFIHEIKEDDFLSHVEAIDDKDGDITQNIIVNHSDVDVTFTVSDSANNTTTVTVGVVILDEVPELLTISNITVEVHEDLPDFLDYITINENYVDDIEVSYVEEVNSNILGEYPVTYKAVLNNIQEEYEIDVQVVDSIPPEIIGIKKIKIKSGMMLNPTKYFTVHDNYDNDDDIQLEVRGYYSLVEPDMYDVTVVATDSSGNKTEYDFQLIVDADKQNQLIIWTTLSLGVIMIGASGALYYIRKKRGN